LTKHRFHAHLTKKFTYGKKLGLDVGCGSGNWDEFKKCKFVGIDKLVERKPDRIVDLEGPLPFDDNTFDVAICYSVLEYIKNDIGLLREIYRVLEPDATFVCITQNKMYKRNKLLENLMSVGFSDVLTGKDFIWSLWYNFTSVYAYTVNRSIK